MKDDKKLLSAEKNVVQLGDIFKGVAACQYLPKTKPKNPATLVAKREGKGIWVVKEKREQPNEELKYDKNKTTMLDNKKKQQMINN